MNIETKYFGTIEIKEEDAIRFENGIPGFPDENTFVFLPLEDTEFLIMQSIQTPSLALITSSPFAFFKDYEFKLSETVLDQLRIESEKDVMILVILNVQNPFSNSSANLLAPIVLNTGRQLGKQIILEKTPYKTKHHLFDKKNENKKEGNSHVGSQA